MASTHLHERINQIQIPAETATMVEQTAIDVVDSVLGKIRGNTINVKDDPKSVDPIIEKADKMRISNNFEDNLRQHKLKEAERVKRELEDKLEHISGNIESLEIQNSPKKQEEEEVKTEKVSLLDKEMRKQYYEEQEKQKREAEEFAKKLKKDRQDWVKEKRKKEKAEHEKMMRKMEVEAQERQKTEEEINKVKQDRIAKLQEAAEQRKLDLERRRQVKSEQQRSHKPRYQQIEEEYNAKIMMPELERRKAELNKKREAFEPVSHEAIQEHSRRYAQMQEERRERREKAVKQRNMDQKLTSMVNEHKSSFTYAFKQHDKEREEEKQREKEERKMLKIKANRYGQIVREMYQPTIDENKASEMQILKERKRAVTQSQRNSVGAATDAYSWRKGRNNSLTNLSANQSSSDTAPPQRRFKENNMIPKPKIPRPSKAVDYLQQRRAQRDESGTIRKIQAPTDWNNDLENENISNVEMAARIKSKAKRMETEARRQELLLSSVAGSSAKGVDVEEDVNDMLIGSIKAKLALLDKIT